MRKRIALIILGSLFLLLLCNDVISEFARAVTLQGDFWRENQSCNFLSIRKLGEPLLRVATELLQQPTIAVMPLCQKILAFWSGRNKIAAALITTEILCFLILGPAPEIE